MNIVAMIGNVAADPELRHTAAGRAVCTFRLAVSRPGADSADFFTVVCWERQAEVAVEYLTIGRRISVEGRLHHTTAETDSGESRSRIEVVAHRVMLLGSPRPAAADAVDADGALAPSTVA